MWMRYYAVFVLALGLFVTMQPPQMSQAVAQTYTPMIREIQISGAQRIEPSTILTYMDARVGDRMDNATLDRALKSLFATGLFADITLRQKRGGVLEVVVVENPIINRIAFEGNDRIKNEELEREILLRPRQVFTRTKVQNDVTRLYQIYRRNGRFAATIDPKVIELDQNRVNLVFEIDEGPVTKIEGIQFIGNEAYSDNKLRDVISTSEKRWYKFLTSSDRYDPDRVSFDEELLRRFYLSQGYADFRVVSAMAELTRDQDSFILTFTVEEGARYRVENININANLRNFEGEALRPYATLESGEWYDADEIESSIDAMTDALGDMQFAFVSIRADADRNLQERTIDVTFTISETPRVFVERINIEGNVRTMDKVLRREMELVEGDPFNRSKLAESERAIRNLDYFETVEVTPRPGSAPDKSVIDVEVTEKSTGELSIGAGFSTSDGPLADFRIRERNLLGRGQSLQLAAVIAGERTEFDLGFTEPYFLHRDLSAGFDVFHITRDLQDESSFDQRRTGGGLRLGYPLSEHWRQTLSYNLQRNEITDVQQGASRFVQDQEGKRTTSSIMTRTTYDTRDSILFPTDGMMSWFETEVAGLGGDAQYVSGKVGSTVYYPVYDQVVLNVLGEAGAITGYGGENVIINERFFIGGSTLRGFESAGIGPRDTATDDALGGNYFYRGTLEMSFPLGLPEDLGVQGHAFTDAGSLWDFDENTGPNVEDSASLRAAAGVGLSWRSPLGPIRVDFSAPYLEEEYDQTETFRFNFGTRF